MPNAPQSASRALAWRHGVLSVDSLGGMLSATTFVLPDGRQVSPFQIAPWADEPGTGDLPALLQRLRGEWPCVPFGGDGDRQASAGWPASEARLTQDPEPHGFGSNHHWSFEAGTQDRISLIIDYPETHPIRRLERHVSPVADSAAIDFQLVVHVRRDCTLPMGLHPCFRLPTQAGAMRIEVPATIAGATFPGDVDATSVFAPGQIAEPWNRVRLRDGGELDVSRVPLPVATEDLVQLLAVPGTASLWNTAEGYRVRIGWNPEHFPSALLWFSNRGRQMAPWNGRHLALGFEPVCSAFDLGAQIAAGANPIAARGVATARRFTAGERFVTTYRIGVEPAGIE